MIVVSGWFAGGGGEERGKGRERERGLVTVSQ